MAFALPVKLSISQPTNFLTYPFDSLPHHNVGRMSEQLCGAELLYGVKQ